MREIGDAVGLSSLSSVTHQLNQLELSGYLRRDPNRPRALEVLIELPSNRRRRPARVRSRTSRWCPLVGRIAAGIPITAEQQVDEVFPLPRQLVGKGDLFMLKVVGESMIDAAICDGDWVVVRQQSTAENGEIVAAMLDGEATVKVFRQRDGHTWLLPRNTRVRADPRRPRRDARQDRRGAALGLTQRLRAGGYAATGAWCVEPAADRRHEAGVLVAEDRVAGARDHLDGHPLACAGARPPHP